MDKHWIRTEKNEKKKLLNFYGDDIILIDCIKVCVAIDLHRLTYWEHQVNVKWTTTLYFIHIQMYIMFNFNPSIYSIVRKQKVRNFCSVVDWKKETEEAQKTMKTKKKPSGIHNTNKAQWYMCIVQSIIRLCSNFPQKLRYTYKHIGKSKIELRFLSVCVIVHPQVIYFTSVFFKNMVFLFFYFLCFMFCICSFNYYWYRRKFFLNWESFSNKLSVRKQLKVFLVVHSNKWLPVTTLLKCRKKIEKPRITLKSAWLLWQISV